MGRHEGPREEPTRRPRGRLMFLAIGITATLVAWGVLVWEAIDFGAQARDGESPAWMFLGLATVGATACLFLTLILVNKVLGAVRRKPEPVVTGGRRAAR
jgi:hypothetical protein